MVSPKVFNATFFGISIPLVVLIVALVFVLPMEPPKLEVGSDTAIWLNFTGPNLNVGGDFTVIYTNPKEIVDVFYENVSVSFSYNVKGNSTTYLPSKYMESGEKVNHTSSIHINAGTVNNTVGFESGLVNFSMTMSASTTFSGITLFNG